MSLDSLKWQCDWSVQRYDEDATRWLANKLGYEPKGFHFVKEGITPYLESEVKGNLLVTAGLTRISNLIIGTGSTQALTSTATRIGTGNGTGTAAVGDTDLSAAAGSGNRYFQILDSTPTVSGGVMTFVATFGSANGNYAWNEFGIDVTASATSGTTVNTPLINHKTSIAQGTKTSGQSWVATATITLS